MTHARNKYQQSTARFWRELRRLELAADLLAAECAAFVISARIRRQRLEKLKP